MFDSLYQISTITQVDRGSTFALRRFTLDFGLGGQRSENANGRLRRHAPASTKKNVLSKFGVEVDYGSQPSCIPILKYAARRSGRNLLLLKFTEFSHLRSTFDFCRKWNFLSKVELSTFVESTFHFRLLSQRAGSALEKQREQERKWESRYSRWTFCFVRL